MTPFLTSVTLASANNAFVHGLSPAMQSLNSLVEEIARTTIPVLLMGESGTGKEIYGRRIHRLSKHSDKPLKKVSCRAVEQREFLALLRAELKENAESTENGQRTVFLDGID